MGESTKHWVEQALYDLDTAQSMFDSGRYLYVLFCCQQAIEKMLKALVAEVLKVLPPRTHNLLRLAEMIKINANNEQMDFLGELSAYYIQTRYPEELPGLTSKIDKNKARRVINKTEEVMQWLKSMLQ